MTLNDSYYVFNMLLSEVQQRTDDVTSAGVIPGIMSVTDRFGATPNTDKPFCKQIIRIHRGGQGTRFCVGINMGRLEITTHIGCPVNCLDCPQALLRSKYNGRLTMDLEDYKRAIDKVPTGTRIDFSGMCEPFTNPHCTDMILYAAEKGFPLALYTTLQGATAEDYKRLRDVTFEVVTIHLPDKDGRSHFNITGEYLAVLAGWPCHNYSCHGQIDDYVVPYLKQRNLITYMHDRAGNVECRPHKNIDTERGLYCVTSGRAMDHNVLLPDGTVIMCCMDYGMTGVFGNLFEQSYDEVLNSDAARVMRDTLNRGESICRHCANAIPI